MGNHQLEETTTNMFLSEAMPKLLVEEIVKLKTRDANNKTNRCWEPRVNVSKSKSSLVKKHHSLVTLVDPAEDQTHQDAHHSRVVEEELVAQAKTLRCKEDSLMRESILLQGDQSVAEPKAGMSDLQATS